VGWKLDVGWHENMRKKLNINVYSSKAKEGGERRQNPVVMSATFFYLNKKKNEEKKYERKKQEAHLTSPSGDQSSRRWEQILGYTRYIPCAIP